MESLTTKPIFRARLLDQYGESGLSFKALLSIKNSILRQLVRHTLRKPWFSRLDGDSVGISYSARLCY